MTELNEEQKALVEKVRAEFHTLVPNADINDLMHDPKVSEILHAIRAFTKDPTCEKGENLLKLAREYKGRNPKC